MRGLPLIFVGLSLSVGLTPPAAGYLIALVVPTVPTLIDELLIPAYPTQSAAGQSSCFDEVGCSAASFDGGVMAEHNWWYTKKSAGTEVNYGFTGTYDYNLPLYYVLRCNSVGVMPCEVSKYRDTYYTDEGWKLTAAHLSGGGIVGASYVKE